MIMHGSTLVIMYGNDLEVLQASILDAGATITKDTFAFPGGRRFHFRDPVGNQLAVWSDKEKKA
jgi:predicted enzyme related to lactoylglutathione lyase